MPDLWLSEAPGGPGDSTSSPSPGARGCLYPPHPKRSQPVYLGRGRKLGTAPDKTSAQRCPGCSRIRIRVRIRIAGRRYWLVSSARPQTSTSALPQYLPLEIRPSLSQNPHLGLVEPELSSELSQHPWQTDWDQRSQGLPGPHTCKVCLHRMRGGGEPPTSMTSMWLNTQ